MPLVDIDEYRGVVTVTVLYFFLYYGLMMLQVNGKIAAAKRHTDATTTWNRATDTSPA